ncbi:MAG TPA: glycosyltransferase family 39 protein [Pyrinomonadaceae bacterium]|nr:glycosyltransferase family 39 protein [Pyrinomonadaceae bacterium]
MMKENHDKFTRYALFTVIAVHLAIVLPLAYWLNIWVDEASTLYTTQSGFLHAFQFAWIDEKQAPLYFWTMSLWRMFGESVFFARLFSIICTTAGIFLVWKFARCFLSDLAAAIAAPLFGLHPLAIWAALEIRGYALGIVLAALLVHLNEALIAQGENARTRPRIAFIIVAAVALYTNYYLGFVLAGCFAANIVSRRAKNVLNFLISMIPVGIVFLPQALLVRDQFAINTQGYSEPRSLIDGLRLVWQHFVTMLLPAGLFPSGDWSSLAFARLWIVRLMLPAVAIFSVLNLRSISNRSWRLLALAATTFGCLLVAYFAVGSDLVELRHATVAFVPVLLAAASLGFDLLSVIVSKPFRLTAAAAGGLVLAIFFQASIVGLYPTMTKRGDWDRVARYLESSSEFRPIYVFPVYDTLALKQTYYGKVHIAPEEGFFRFARNAPAGSPTSLVTETDFFISQIGSGSKEIWLVTGSVCTETLACTPLESYVKANYTIVAEQDFYLEKVRLLRKIDQ